MEAYSASAKYRAGSEVWPLGQRLACVIQDLWEAINFITDPSIPRAEIVEAYGVGIYSGAVVIIGVTVGAIISGVAWGAK